MKFSDIKDIVVEPFIYVKEGENRNTLDLHNKDDEIMWKNYYTESIARWIKIVSENMNTIYKTREEMEEEFNNRLRLLYADLRYDINVEILENEEGKPEARVSVAQMI